MKLSIIILNYNVRYFLELCLQSVFEATKDISAEVIVVDNNSSDDGCQMVKANFPKAILIKNTSNLGFSAGNNIGVKKATGDYLCILNPDTVVAEDTFKTLLQFVDRQDNCGVVGCRLVDGRGRFLPESKRNIPIAKVALQKILGNTKHYYANQVNEKSLGKVDVLVGAFMFIKKSVYEQVGGFDEDYFMYGEDIDFSYRVLKAGYENYYFGKTTIIHFKGESTLKDKQYAQRFFGAMKIFYKKHFKKHWLFDAFVGLGIKMAHRLRKEKSQMDLIPDNYLLLSDKQDHPILNKLVQPYDIVATLSMVKPKTEIIFDADFLSFSKIIDLISKPDINENATFKIIPQNANFMIGSNDSKSRGEVIHY